MRSFLPTAWEGRLAPVSGTARMADCARAEETEISTTSRTRTVAPLLLLLENVDFDAGNGQRVEQTRQGDFEGGQTPVECGQFAVVIAGAAVGGAQHDLAGEGGEAAGTLAIASGFQLLELIICHTKVNKSTSGFLHAGIPLGDFWGVVQRSEERRVGKECRS